MRTTIYIDDDLYLKAVELTGIEETTVLIREGFFALIERESARRLTSLGCSEPNLAPIARRRSKPEE